MNNSKERDEAVVKARQEGKTWDQVAKQLCLTYPQIARIRKRLRRDGGLEPKPTPFDALWRQMAEGGTLPRE